MTGILTTSKQGNVLLHSEELDTFYIGDTYEDYDDFTHSHQLMEFLEYVVQDDLATVREEDIYYKVKYGEYVSARDWGYVKHQMKKSGW